MKMFRTHLTVIGLLFFVSSAVQADDLDSILKALKADILSVFGDDALSVSTSVEDGEQFQLEYQTRKFMVHNASMNGEWSENATKVAGPSHSGMIVHVVLHKNADLENEQWARIKDSRGATVAAPVREPYWDKMIWVMPLEGKDLTARIDLSYGSRVTNTPLHENLMTLFAGVR